MGEEKNSALPFALAEFEQIVRHAGDIAKKAQPETERMIKPDGTIVTPAAWDIVEAVSVALFAITRAVSTNSGQKVAPPQYDKKSFRFLPG